MTQHLKACPFCGRNDAIVIITHQCVGMKGEEKNIKFYHIECGQLHWGSAVFTGCRSKGALASSKEEAITFWNARAISDNKPDREENGQNGPINGPIIPIGINYTSSEFMKLAQAGAKLAGYAESVQECAVLTDGWREGLLERAREYVAASDSYYAALEAAIIQVENIKRAKEFR